MKKVLIFDHSLGVTGHRLPYARRVADAFPECEIIIALANQIKGDPNVEEYFSDFNVTYFSSADYQLLGISFARESVRCLKQLVKLHNPDHVVVPTADGLATLIGLGQLFGGNRWLRNKTSSACLMKGGWPRGLPLGKKLIESLKWWLITKGPWTHLMLIDPLAWSGLGKTRDERILLCPDPVPIATSITRQSARAQLALPEDGRLITSVGNQDSRKGTDLLMAAFEQANLKDNDRLLLIGKVSDSIRPLCDRFSSKQNLQNRLFIKDEYVSDEMFQIAILASDVVAAPYRETQRPSGVVSRSVGWNRPILATNSGWLQWICDQLQVGTTVDVTNPSLFAQSICQSLDDSSHYRMSNHAKEFAKYNTQENYLRIWNLGVQECPSIAPFLNPGGFLANQVD